MSERAEIWDTFLYDMRKYVSWKGAADICTFFAVVCLNLIRVRPSRQRIKVGSARARAVPSLATVSSVFNVCGSELL